MSFVYLAYMRGVGTSHLGEGMLYPGVFVESGIQPHICSAGATTFWDTIVAIFAKRRFEEEVNLAL